MNQAEFMQETQNLCNLYGKGLNNTQAEFWYKNLQQFDIHTYQRAIVEYVRKNKYMPKIADLLEIMKRIKKEPKKEEKRRKDPMCQMPKGWTN